MPVATLSPAQVTNGEQIVAATARGTLTADDLEATATLAMTAARPRIKVRLRLLEPVILPRAIPVSPPAAATRNQKLRGGGAQTDHHHTHDDRADPQPGR